MKVHFTVNIRSLENRVLYIQILWFLLSLLCNPHLHQTYGLEVLSFLLLYSDFSLLFVTYAIALGLSLGCPVEAEYPLGSVNSWQPIS